MTDETVPRTAGIIQFRRDRRMRRNAWSMLAALALVVFASRPASAYTILAPNAIVAGKSIADWTGDWWTWALQAPNSTNPVFNDPTGAFANVNNNGPIFFVAGNTATRSFTVPAGKPILLPLINTFDVESVPTDLPSNTLADRETAANLYVAAWQSSGVDTGSLFASIDGQAVPNLSNYLEVTGLFDMGPVQAGSFLDQVFQIPPGTDTFPSKSGGYWLMITDLSPGPHQLHFGGSDSAFTPPPNCCTNYETPAFSTETTDTIVVVPEPASCWPMLAGLSGLGLLRLRRRRPGAPP